MGKLKVNSKLTGLQAFNFDISNSYSTAGGNLSSTNISNNNLTLNVLTNSSGKVANIFGLGFIELINIGGYEFSCSTILRPSSEITITASFFIANSDSTQGGHITIKTDGTLTIHGYNPGGTNKTFNIFVIPSLYFLNDF